MDLDLNNKSKTAIITSQLNLTNMDLDDKR